MHKYYIGTGLAGDVLKNKQRSVHVLNADNTRDFTSLTDEEFYIWKQIRGVATSENDLREIIKKAYENTEWDKRPSVTTIAGILQEKGVLFWEECESLDDARAKCAMEVFYYPVAWETRKQFMGKPSTAAKLFTNMIFKKSILTPEENELYDYILKGEHTDISGFCYENLGPGEKVNEKRYLDLPEIVEGLVKKKYLLPCGWIYVDRSEEENVPIVEI